MGRSVGQLGEAAWPGMDTECRGSWENVERGSQVGKWGHREKRFPCTVHEAFVLVGLVAVSWHGHVKDCPFRRHWGLW